MRSSTIEAVAFDVNETLFSLDRLGPAFANAGLDPHLVPLWFATVLRDGFALATLGGYRSFTEIAEEALRALGEQIDDTAVGAVTAAMHELDPHPDTAPALRTLHAAGVPVITLTNGTADVVRALLARSGLSGHVAGNLSVDAVRRWKPAAEPYRYAAAEASVEPGRLALVATHPWDCAGARAAGLRPAWVRRGATRWPGVFPEPEFSGPDLTTVADMLLSAGS